MTTVRYELVAYRFKHEFQRKIANVRSSRSSRCWEFAVPFRFIEYEHREQIGRWPDGTSQMKHYKVRRPVYELHMYDIWLRYDPSVHAITLREKGYKP